MDTPNDYDTLNRPDTPPISAVPYLAEGTIIEILRAGLNGTPAEVGTLARVTDPSYRAGTFQVMFLNHPDIGYSRTPWIIQYREQGEGYRVLAANAAPIFLHHDAGIEVRNVILDETLPGTPVAVPPWEEPRVTDAPMPPTQAVVDTLTGVKPKDPDAFDAEAWVHHLCSQTGVRVEDLTGTLHEQLIALPNKHEVNKLFFQYSESLLKPDVLGPDDIELFNELATISDTPRYNSIKEGIESLQRQIARRHMEIADMASNLISNVRDLRLMKERDEVLLAPDIEKILKDGWYKYDRAKTIDWNNSNQDRWISVWFTTPDVVITHHNKAAGIDMKVNLGSFAIQYAPRAGKIRVFPNNRNLFVDEDEGEQGFYHPHVYHDGEVCWGNAGAVYSAAISNMTPSKALPALRTLLQTYNDESPYRDLIDFAIQKDPTLMANLPGAYQLVEDYDSGHYYTRVWAMDDDLNSYHRDYERDYRYNDDEEKEVCLQVFMFYRRGTGEIMPGYEDRYYYKTRTGMYVEIESFLEGEY